MFNVTDFPTISVDRFANRCAATLRILDLLDLAPRIVINELAIQANSNRRRPRTLSGLLEALTQSGVGSFVDEVGRLVRSGGRVLSEGR